MFVFQSSIEENVVNAISGVMSNAGYDLVRVRIRASGKNNVLQVMFERHDLVPVGIDDCSKINSLISPLLDVEDCVSGRYMLEISSPGHNRPLTRINDFTNSIGKQVHFVMKSMVLPINRRKFNCIIKNFTDGTLLLNIEDHEDVAVNIVDILEANLIGEISTGIAKKKQKINKMSKDIISDAQLKNKLSNIHRKKA